MSANGRTSGRGYPLSALLLLVTASGVILAVVAPIVRGPREAGWGDVLAASITGGVALTVLGAFLGLFHYSRWRGVLCGAPLGGVLGLLLGPLIYVPPASFPEVILTAVGGAVVIVGVAALARLTSAAPKTGSGVGSPFQEPHADAKRNPASFEKPGGVAVVSPKDSSS